jgi:hypothetical protein
MAEAAIANHKVVPDYVRTAANTVEWVSFVFIHPPNTHPPESPIKRELTAVQVVTDSATRWYGFEEAWIGSDLRVHVKGFDPRFEEVAAWADAEVER